MTKDPDFESLRAIDPEGLWLGKPAPRYTSYPPAPFFRNDIVGADFVTALKAMPPNEPISLYIHIPFCRVLCLYCGCNTAVTHRDDRLADYVRVLRREIAMMASFLGRRPVSHLHFGGGTPNILPAPVLRDLFEQLRQCFDLDAAHEIAVELDPRSVTREQVDVLSECGVNRVSLGVQDFNPEVQEIVHRIQPYEMVVDVCSWLRDKGITRINFDLMYGLPKQTPESVAETVDKALGLRPSRVAIFSYAHVPQMKRHQQVLEAYGLPNILERLKQDSASRTVIAQHGYREIGMDHYAAPDDPIIAAMNEGRLARNFQGYTDDTAKVLLGIGASSISYTPMGYYQNARDEDDYKALIEVGEIATCRGFVLSEQDKLRATIIEQLMCSFSCDVDEVCRQYGLPTALLVNSLAALAPYERAGLVSRDAGRVTIHTPHPMAARVICTVFDAYTAQRAAATVAA